jgi:iron complex outermembrane recepter protein
MTRSRHRKLRHLGASSTSRLLQRGLPLAAAILACLPAAQAEERAESPALEEIIVTATKRAESLQNVPISIQALGSAKLEELHVESFEDYAKFLPSVTYQTFGPGLAKIYMRGISTGGTPNHSGPLPSVGVYLDEQPITTIQGPLDIHVYDIARVESLAGPQGTLYGASSQAGTLRIITNKPELGKTSGGYDVQGNVVSHGDQGGVIEGFVNLPIGSNAAVRLVAWGEHDAGYIDNVHGTLNFPSVTSAYATGVVGPAWTLDNAPYVKDHYNSVDTTGLRGALKVALGESWTITPVVQAQHTSSRGLFAFDPRVGDLKVQHYSPEFAEDRWTQLAATVEGKIGNLDLTYSTGYLARHDETHSDYADYSLAYSVLYSGTGIGSYNTDNAGNPIQSAQRVHGTDRYRMQSNELRIASAKTDRFRFVAGGFASRQTHDIRQEYQLFGVNGSPDLGSKYSVTGWAPDFWLTNEQRVNRDSALFTELSFDWTPKLTQIVGVRRYWSDNTLEGFFGYGQNNDWTSHTGEKDCLANVGLAHSPGILGNYCNDIHTGGFQYDYALGQFADTKRPYVNGVETKGSGWTPKYNFTYKFDDARMAYVTYARGFRPGGLNRVGSLPPYRADYLNSYELGWKTSWMNNRVRFNGAVYSEKWSDFQFAFLGPNSVTQVANAGDARINGLESQIDWAVGTNLTLSSGLAYTDAFLLKDYVGFCHNAPCSPPQAPAGQMLPTTPKFKGNFEARYTWQIGEFEAHAQGAYVYQTYSWEDLRTIERQYLGKQKPFGVADVSFGLSRKSLSYELFVTNLFDKRQDLYRYSECTEAVCGGGTTGIVTSSGPDYVSLAPFGYTGHVYSVPGQPRTIGLKIARKF